MLFYKTFSKQKEVFGATTEKKDGIFLPFFSPQSFEKILKIVREKNLKNAKLSNLVVAQQIHKNKVYFCKEKDGGIIKLGIDGLISNTKEQVLLIRTADCLPIFIYDQKRYKIALLHAGKRGLFSGIIKECLKKMASDPKDLLVVFGPHIRKCCYSIGEKRNILKSKFKKYIIVKNKKAYFDLTALAIDQLIAIGVRKKMIEDCKICTACKSERFFSFRKEQKKYFNQKSFPCFISFLFLRKSPQERAIEILKKGGVIAYPTETVYGLGADIFNLKAVKRVFEIKKRSFKNPISIAVADIDQLKKIAKLDSSSLAICKKILPGPFTVLLPKRKVVSDILTANKKLVGVRMPELKSIRELIKKFGRPITSTSANISGEAPIVNSAKIDLEVDFILEGECKYKKASTVLDILNKKILRKGPKLNLIWQKKLF